MTPEDVVARIDPQEVVDLALALGNIDSPTGSEGPAGQFVYDWLAAKGFATAQVRPAPRTGSTSPPGIMASGGGYSLDLQRAPRHDAAPGRRVVGQGPERSAVPLRLGRGRRDLRRRRGQRQGPDGGVPGRGQGDPRRRLPAQGRPRPSAPWPARSAASRSRSGRARTTCPRTWARGSWSPTAWWPTSRWWPRAPASASSASSRARPTSRSPSSPTRRATTRRTCRGPTGLADAPNAIVRTAAVIEAFERWAYEYQQSDTPTRGRYGHDRAQGQHQRHPRRATPST